jgi:hypothetical protein
VGDVDGLLRLWLLDRRGLHHTVFDEQTLKHPVTSLSFAEASSVLAVASGSEVTLGALSDSDAPEAPGGSGACSAATASIVSVMV